MPRGEHLQALNQQRAAAKRERDMAELLTPEPGRTGSATAVMEEEPEEQPEPRLIDTGNAEHESELERLRNANAAMLEELVQTRKALQREFGSVPSFTTGAPIISKPLPNQYVVWLGPEPPEDGQICFAVRGVIKVIPNTDRITMIDGDGDGKPRTISKTSNLGIVVANPYVDAGRTSIEFRYRCPSNHKYAGKLWASLFCPEHAAWLYLSAPDGQGGDRNLGRLFAFHLGPDWRVKYEAMKKSKMRKREIEHMEVEDVWTHGVEMPPAGESHVPFQ